MMRSMYSGVSGLRAHQTKMDVIGNNIANVNTIGYKSQRVTFGEVFSQTTQKASSASDETGRGGRNAMQIGLGTGVSSIDLQMNQGSAQRTDNPFDMMIEGDGFFIVGDAEGTYFTKAGALRQDDAGNLVIPNGMKVMGWPASPDGKKIEKGAVEPLRLNDPANKTADPQTTTLTKLSGNLNTKDGENGIPTQIKMYDSLGNLYTMPVYLVYDAEAGANGQWQIYNEKDTSTDPATFSNGPIVLKNQDNKEFVTTATFPGQTIEFDTAGKLVTNPSSFELEQIDLTSATPKLNATIGGEDGLVVDFSGFTQFAAKTEIDTRTDNGRSAGEMISLDVGPDGKITSYYDNGETKLLGQIAIAEFDNPAGLEKAGDNIFRATANSGDFDGVGQEGVLMSGVLEMSNVDLSKEFTEMIVGQRGFQANSRIINVSSEILQDLVNLGR